jgi:putative flippase GtrA
LGVAVQLVTLATLTHQFGVHYLLATALAVEAALLHNFLWHQSWTWNDLKLGPAGGALGRLARFHFTNGLSSIVGNLVLMKLLVELFQLPVLVANLSAITILSIANFLMSHYFVFRR